MRGLATAGRVVRLERASLSTKANVASDGWLFIGLAWIPFLARGSGFNLPARTSLMILFVGRLLETMALWCAAGRGQVDDLPDVGLPTAVEAAGSRAAVGRRGSDRVSDP